MAQLMATSGIAPAIDPDKVVMVYSEQIGHETYKILVRLDVGGEHACTAKLEEITAATQEQLTSRINHWAEKINVYRTR